MIYDPSGFISALKSLSANGGWEIDSGALSHMSSNDGTLSSLHPLPVPHSVTVGNGASMPVTVSGHTYIHTPCRQSFTLKDVLYVPTLIRNLLSVRKFTRDNKCSIELNPIGFSVKDLKMKAVILRCNSSGDLYIIP